jgi:hypothetical protein
MISQRRVFSCPLIRSKAKDIPWPATLYGLRYNDIIAMDLAAPHTLALNGRTELEALDDMAARAWVSRMPFMQRPLHNWVSFSLDSTSIATSTLPLSVRFSQLRLCTSIASIRNTTVGDGARTWITLWAMSLLFRSTHSYTMSLSAAHASCFR